MKMDIYVLETDQSFKTDVSMKSWTRFDRI
jgi:hypothetical protein